MRPILIPALVAAMLSAPAFAATTAQHAATGMVKSWDANARVLTLDSGATYTLPVGNWTALHGGEKIKVIYQFRDGRNIASMATVVK